MILFGAQSDFSIGESILKVEKIVQLAHQYGYSGVAIADTMEISCLPTLASACKNKGIDHYIGARIRLVAQSTEKIRKQQEYFPEVWVRNDEGFRDICQMLTLANDEDHFYYKSRLNINEVAKFVNRGNLFLSTGFNFGISHAPDAVKWLQSFDKNLVYISMPSRIGGVSGALSRAEMAAGMHIATALGIDKDQMIYGRPAFYEKGKHESKEVMSATIKKFHDAGTVFKVAPDYYLMSPAAGGTKTGDFAERVDYKFHKLDISLPKMSDNEMEDLVKAAKDGLGKVFTTEIMGYKPDKKDFPVYIDRLKKELQTIKKMGFERYFLVVKDLVDYCEREGIVVGPGRGSVGGSLLAYCLNITAVDPIRFNLLFERFINASRIDLPDIDLDFQSSRRGEIIQYLESKYGESHVAGISNYNLLGSKSAIRDLVRFYDQPFQLGNITSQIGELHGKVHSLKEAFESSDQVKAFSKDYPEIWSKALDLEGVQRAIGRHAAAVVVANEPLTNRAVIKKSSNDFAINWDKRSSEDFGLVKLDILGLSNLDLLQKCKQYIKDTTGEVVNLKSIPLDDKKTLKAFESGNTSGVFQFESSSVRKLLKDISVCSALNFNDLMAANALNRPGPLQSGMAQDYILIRQGLNSEFYENDEMKEVLQETYSVVVYQEQVSKMTVSLAGFSLIEADNVRKAMGKKDPVAMKKWTEKFVKGAMKHSGMSEKNATELWNKLESFAGYGFNKSHACAYSMISFWTQYMKTHYPLEFVAAALGTFSEDKMPSIVEYANAVGIKIVPPQVNQSLAEEFVLDKTNKCLIIPFIKVKGLGKKACQSIMKARKEGGAFKSIEDFEDRVNKRTVNIRIRTNLDKIGSFVEIDPTALPVDDDSRTKDQTILLPGLISKTIRPDRMLREHSLIRKDLERGVLAPIVTKNRKQCEGCEYSSLHHVMPLLGKEAKVMVVFDGPNWSETGESRMLAGKASKDFLIAMKNAGIKASELYVTTLVKAKDGKNPPNNGVISRCSLFLDKEIEIMNPAVILVMGSKAMKHLAPGVKGGVKENIGTVLYDSSLDASIVIGFNPAMIWHDPAKRAELDDVMNKVGSMIHE